MSATSPHHTLEAQEELLAQYQLVRTTTIDICAPLQPEDYVVQPIDFVSPPKWHLGHSTWFFENFILAPHLEGYVLFDERLNWFFNSYYESQGPRILRSKRGNMTRPSLEKVVEYRRYVDQFMEQFLCDKGADISEEVQQFITIGLHHEQQHQELLVMDIKYILGNNPLFPGYGSASSAEETARASGFLSVESGLHTIGHQGDGFSWDNESGAHQVYLEAFDIQDRLVTNGEYLEFIEAGGYDQFQHWLSEGWEWIKGLEVKAPLYWYPRNGKWFEYTLGGIKELNPDLPVVHLSYFEADAFARWKGMRLPTEFEWEVACRKYHPEPAASDNFMERGSLHPTPANSPTDYQFLGQVWEWTGSAYLPYPRYPQLEGALGEYNGKFMINQMVLRGGACATPQSHIRLTYRNFFHPQMRWQFAGFRLAKHRG